VLDAAEEEKKRKRAAKFGLTPVSLLAGTLLTSAHNSFDDETPLTDPILLYILV